MKKTGEQLREMMQTSPVRAGQRWRHYKGDVYLIEELLIDCNTNEIIVSYINNHWDTPVYGIKFTRPLAEWFDEVEPDIQRFCRVQFRNILATDSEFEMMQILTKNKKEQVDEGLGRMRELWNRISRRFGY
jgi:hypothetical protein